MTMTQFNDGTSTLTLLATRRSGKARDMIAPGPDAAELETILQAAIRVPDHGKLAPWRFLVIPPDRQGALARLLVTAYQQENPQAGRLELEAMEAFPRQAPCLVIAISAPVPGSKIPVWEQELSIGAACQNAMLAAHASGFVGNWLTGWPAYSAAVNAALGLAAHERIAGYLFFGTAAKELSERPRPDYDAVVQTWEG